jgi:hypothetical protein
MWAEAIITPKDCEDFVRSMMPFEIVLDALGKRALSLEHPARVALVAERGIMIETPARLRWTVAGAEVPISIRLAQVLLLPTIATHAGRDALVFTLRVERAEFVSLPDSIDKSITSRLNEALEKSPARLVWNFTKALDFHFKLPLSIRPARQIDLTAKWGRVRVTDEAVVLALSFHAEGVLLLRPAIHGRPALPTIPEPEAATRRLHAVPLRRSS